MSKILQIWFGDLNLDTFNLISQWIIFHVRLSLIYNPQGITTIPAKGGICARLFELAELFLEKVVNLCWSSSSSVEVPKSHISNKLYILLPSLLSPCSVSLAYKIAAQLIKHCKKLWSAVLVCLCKEGWHNEVKYYLSEMNNNLHTS